MNRRLTAFAVICAVALAAAVFRFAPKDAKDATFRVGYEARLTVSGDGLEQEVNADAAVDYTWKRDGKVRTLVLESFMMKAVVDGEEMMNAKMSRAGASITKAGQKIDIKFEDAPEDKKKILTDMFGSPICKIELDAIGREVNRTVVADRGLPAMLDNGAIANCTMFHPWYAPDQDEWKAYIGISTVESVAKGTVTYKKAPGGKAGLQLVMLKGTLTDDDHTDRHGNTIIDRKYTVAGEQTYDTTREEWVTGRVTMDIYFKLARNDKELGTAKGTATATFEMLPEKR
jgi:hypothetical protein